VSVLMPNFNKAAFVAAAIESILNQTYPHFQLIICDDGSTDDSLAVIRPYVERDPRLVLVVKENGGHASALNAAFARSRGALICLLDADDLVLPTKLAMVVERLSQDRAGLLIHPLTVIDREGRPIVALPAFSRLESGWLAPKLWERGGRWAGVPTAGLCFRREVATHVFPIPERIENVDFFIYTLLPLLTPVTALEVPLYLYRMHGANSAPYQAHPSGQFMAVGHPGFATLDLALVQQTLNGFQLVYRAVSERLAAAGCKRQLELGQNLYFRECRFCLQLLSRPAGRGQLLREYRRLARAVLRDDVYTWPRKVAILPIYAIAILLPSEWRAWWLSRSLLKVTGFNRTKDFLRRIWRVFSR